MSLTQSTMLSLGTKAPFFSLPDTCNDNEIVSSEDLVGKPMLVMFVCNHCPYVKHVAPELARLGKDYADKVGIVAISSNDIQTHPQDSPDKMKEEATAQGYTFPYLYDASQSVAKDYTAACTPDFFLFDADHRLAYRGQLDETRPTRISSGNYNHDNAANGKDLRAAIDAVLAGEPVADQQIPSMGCNIKWTPGSEPNYAG